MARVAKALPSEFTGEEQSTSTIAGAHLFPNLLKPIMDANYPKVIETGVKLIIPSISIIALMNVFIQYIASL